MELNEAIAKRRSIRKYQKKEVAKELIDEMITAAIEAPTWKNSQTGRYHVVMSEECWKRSNGKDLLVLTRRTPKRHRC